MKRFLSVLALAVIFAVGAYPQVDRQNLRQQLLNKLSGVKTKKDSIKLLYDIFDLSYQKDQEKIGEQLFDVALRAGDVSTCLDMLRNLSSANSSSENQVRLLAMLEKVPAGKERNETELYLQLRQIVIDAHKESEKGRQQNIAEIIHEYNEGDTGGSQYEEIKKLYTLCCYIGNEVTGDLLVQYIDELDRLLKESDIDLYAITNLFYTRAANIYSATGYHSKAVEADRKLLKIIKQLEHDYAKSGRKYRDYSRNYFICYRRMLGNYEALTPEEVERYYNLARQQIEKDKDVKEYYDQKHRIDIYYNMAKGRFAEAIPFIREQLKSEKDLKSRRELLNMMSAAGEAVGDSAAILEALGGKNAMLAEYNELNASERYKELQIKYEVNRLQASNDKLMIEQRDKEIQTTRRIMIMVFVGWVIFAIVLCGMIFFYARSRRASMRLTSLVSDLVAERDRMKHLHYDRSFIGVDKSLTGDINNKKSDKIKESVFDPNLIEKLVDNILFVSSIGHNVRENGIKTLTVTNLMRKAAHVVNPDLGPGVELVSDLPHDNIDITIDEDAAIKVLASMMRFAIRNTPNGKVELSCRIDQATGMVSFYVTDNGNTIPVGMEHVIFRSFADLQHLPAEERAIMICRMVALLLGGGMRIDTNYKDGTRQILTLPLVAK